MFLIGLKRAFIQHAVSVSSEPILTDAAANISGIDGDKSGRSNASFCLKINRVHYRLIGL